MDSYKLFNLKKDNFTWDELKKSYKKLAIRNHPDKGGDENLFNHITLQFKKLALELNQKDNNKSHFDLKKQFNDNIPSRYGFNNISDNEQNFNQKFNKIFNENKYIDEDIEFGYGDTMVKSTKHREDFNIKNIFGKNKVKNNIFNETFEKKIPTTNIIKYKEPEPLPSSKNLIHSELGAKTTDYTGKTSNNSLQYTDFSIAFNEERIPNIDKTKKIFKNIKEYQQYSDSYLNKQFTEKELKRKIQFENIEKNNEKLRLKRIIEKDKKIEEHYNKVTNLLYN
jgi:curved DNA-binding protein CbpA